MNDTVENGTRKQINDVTHVFYDGYWIKCYKTPQDNLQAKKYLIQSLAFATISLMGKPLWADPGL